MSTESTGTDISGTDTTDDAAAVALPAERCGQCGAPAAVEQRYCLNCGFHRRNAPDPVARYLSEASAARARVAEAAALAAQRRRRPRFGARITATLVAVALLIGLVIGNATGGNSVVAGRSDRLGAARTSTTVTEKHSSKAKSATGSSYLQQEQNLPSSVTP